MDFFITVLLTGYEFFGRACGGLYAAEALSVSPECKLVAVNLSTRVRKMSLIFSSDRFNREAAADKRHHEDLRLLRNNGWVEMLRASTLSIARLGLVALVVRDTNDD
jgi:hypothetical protein